MVFPIFCSDFETIDLLHQFALLPASALIMSIMLDKDAMCTEMDKIVARGGFCVFMDGSGFEGGVYN
jgi:hypothetical protein